MAAIEGGEARRFDAGGVVRDAFGVIGRHAASFVAAGLVCYGAPQLLMGWGQIRLADASGAFNWLALGAVLLGFLGLIVGGTVVQVAYTKVAVGDLTGRPATMRTALDEGARIFWPALILGILSGLGIGLATLLLIAPGLIVATMWAVAMPVLAVERPDHTRAFNRSQSLTKGYRWPVFGLLIAILIGYLLIYVLAGLIGMALGAASLFDDQSLAGLIASVLAALLGNLLFCIGASALYVELRRVKEGGGTDQLAAIFE